ncbi:MAG: ATP-binding cassette domain-containing protein [Candidatus Cryptobacteroides sp.]|uniref:ATP-binding cassette domain-containing protein n=1 Tax=Candidatus Cryptobacteroides sp. TaxID=2952915 RepID=UPI002A915C92|nr:ATP-binding cassette domain-containing protein [Candidatus Cryptobacteroides sp.]MDY5566335.1 ATP-binding cassette domain-containing protein [Candidatus Cryptobacteroides sp.]
MNETAKPIVRIESGLPMVREWQLAAPVDFVFGAGEHIAVFGRNGAGKTKLVEIILGRHPVKKGIIEYAFPSPVRKYVSENVKYLAFKDCYGGETEQNYYLQQRWNSWDVDDERILLSSGELRKHSLSKVLGTEPCLLILDNPFVGLDAASRLVLGEQLRAIVQGGKTSLMLVLSREDEIPPFMTHVVEVKDEIVLPKKRLADWLAERGTETCGKEQDCGPGQAISAGDAHCNADSPSSENGTSALQAADAPASSPEIVRLNKVTIRYGERTILKDLDWVVRKGEHWSLTGPNGSGKSTLLGLVCADNPQSYACDISLFGRKRGSGESIWDIKKHIGYVSPELHRSFKRDITAERIVANGLRDFHGLFTKANEEEIRTARKCLERFGAGHLAGTSFLNMSSGEQRIVLLARAFVKNADLLILDEPFHGLDDGNVRMVRGIIEEYCQNPDNTLLMVTHRMEELPSCIDHNLTLKVNR